jgi:hypothetical protein
MWLIAISLWSICTLMMHSSNCNTYTMLLFLVVYICITPNRLSEPHDVSRDFDVIATGFHLKEYTVLELSNLFRKVGFSQIRAYVGFKVKYLSLPVFPLAICEKLLEKLPFTLRRTIARNLPFSLLLDIRLVGVK